MNVTEMPQTPPALRPVNDPDTLCRALVRARKQCRPTVHKGGHNRDQNYSYVGHEQVLLSGARDALLDHGLTLEQRAVEYIGELSYSTRSGTRPVWRWRGTFELEHVSGEKRTYTYEATTQANDKAAFVASTALDRVAHLRLLELAGSDEENPEHDSHDRHAQREQVQAAPPREAAQAPQKRPSQPPPPATPKDALPGVLEMFLPKLRARKTEAELTEWVRQVGEGNYPPAYRRQLWEAFSAHATTLKLSPERIAMLATKKKPAAPEEKK